ncbi:hypothetical protein Tco_0811421 [Tanacetum coccineum]
MRRMRDSGGVGSGGEGMGLEEKEEGGIRDGIERRRDQVERKGEEDQRRGKEEIISSKEIVFTKEEKTPTETVPKVTSNTKSECDIQEPLPPLPKLSGAKPIGTSNDVTKKESSVKTIKKKAQTKSPSVPDPTLDKKAELSTEQLLLTLMKNQIFI